MHNKLLASPIKRSRLTAGLASLLWLATAATGLAQLDPLSKCIQLDPLFRYYQNRSHESIASELRINGYGSVRYVVTRDGSIDKGIVDALRRSGIAVWYTTFGNGVYNTKGLPAGWENWRMKHKDPAAVQDGFTFLCMNHPGYRAWKKSQTAVTLRSVQVDGVDVMETFWPAHEGPKNKLYGCVCDHCAAAFTKMFPEAASIPNFTDSKHPDYYRSNKELYRNWVEFRARSVADFLDDFINGPGGIRRHFPRLKVSVWGIASDIPNAVATIKEWEGIDGSLIVSTVKPDVFVIQTDWPDWMKPNLPPEYPLKYKPFVDAIRATGSKIPVQLQPDIGSDEKCRRGADWLAKCEVAAKEAGISGLVPYEYHISLDIYEAQPKPMFAWGLGNTVTVIFNKRLEETSATAPDNYTANGGGVVAAKVDGNIVKLEVTGRPSQVTVRNLKDDPGRRLFKNHPAATMPEPMTLPVQWR